MVCQEGLCEMIGQQAEKEYWTEAYGGIQNYLALNCHEGIVNWLAFVYDVVGKRILDVGGGPGIHCSLLQEKYYARCSNIDNSNLAGAYSISELRISTCIHDLETFPWPLYDEFDFIFSIQVLEHLREEVMSGVAAEIYKLLRCNGHLFLSVARPDNKQDKDHKTLKPLDWWHEIFVSAGFQADLQRSVVASNKGLPQNDWNCLYLLK